MSGLEGLHDGNDRGGLGPVALPATNSQGEAGPVDQQPDDDLGVDPPLFGVADLAQVVLLLGLEVEGGYVVQAQGQTPTGGDVPEQSPRQALAVAPLPAAPQGAEQGPHADRLQAQITQETGGLGLGGWLDQTCHNHLLKGPIIPDRLTKPRRAYAPCRTYHSRPERLETTVGPTRSVSPGAGSRDSRCTSLGGCEQGWGCVKASGRMWVDTLASLTGGLHDPR